MAPITPTGKEIGYPQSGTALIKPPTEEELIATPQIAEQFMGEEEFVGPREVTNAPLTFGPQFDPRKQALADYQPSAETIEFLNNATPEEADRYAYEFARALSQPRIEDAGDELTFTKIWKQQNGDPNAIDPSKQGREAHKAARQDDWEDLFPDVPYGGYLTEEQEKIWAKERSNRLANRKNEAFTEKQNQQKSLEFAVKQFRARNAEERARIELEIEKDKAQREQQVKAARNVKAYVTPEGDIKYLHGNEVPPIGWVPYSATKHRKEGEKIKEAELGARKLSGAIRRLRKLISGKPEFLGALGKGTRVVNSLAQQLHGLQNLMTGANLTVDNSLLNPDRYTFEGFDKNAVKSAQAKSAILNLAYVYAMTELGQEGRALSDNDMQRALEIIGGRTGSPEQLEGVLNDILERSQRSFRNVYKVYRGIEPPASMMQEIFPGVQTQASPGGGRTVVRRGKTGDGRNVVQYSDGSIEYAD
jgi:hypothetical protein